MEVLLKAILIACVAMHTVLSLESWTVPDLPQWSRISYDAEEGSPYKLVTGCISADQCCELLRDLLKMQRQMTDFMSELNRAPNDCLVESVHDQITNELVVRASTGETTYAPGTYSHDFQNDVVGIFSCRDTLPWHRHQSPPDPVDQLSSRTYDYLPLKNGKTIEDGTIYLPAKEAKYRYNYFFRCPKGYKMTWDKSRLSHYGGWSERLLIVGRPRSTKRHRHTLLCDPNEGKDHENLERRFSEALTMTPRTAECVEGVAESFSDNVAASMTIELEAKFDDENQSGWYPSSKASITEKKPGQMIVNLPGDLGLAWTRLIPTSDKSRTFRGCLSIPWAPNQQKRLPTALTMTITPVLL